MASKYNATVYQPIDGKPKGGKPGTLVTSNYDLYCSGCGESFRELAEGKERPYESGSLDRPDSIIPSSKIGPQVPYVPVTAPKSTGSVYLANGLLAGSCEITDQGYSELHRCNIGVALVQGKSVAVRCIGAWTWQELVREEVQA